MSTQLKFLGAARTVTGSRFLLESREDRILVDCGLFQGVKDLRVRNWGEFPVDPISIGTVLITHAHLDHIGALPLLVRDGFRGEVHCSIPTMELARLVLLDAAHIQEEDAEAANRGGWTLHRPAQPLYTVADAERALALIKPVDIDRWQSCADGIRFRLRPSGHILGSTFVEIDCRGMRLVFSGDLGRREPLVIKPPVSIERADWLILESTYGDRNHPTEHPLKELHRIVSETLQRRGTLIVPSFAVGRTQDLLYLFHQLREENKIPDVPIYIDSPMAIDVTRLYTSFNSWHRLPERGIKSLSEGVVLVHSKSESERVLHGNGSRIVIAGAGMVTGGRVLNHLKKHLPREQDTVLLVGYQAAGTRGRQLQEGASEVKIQGQYVPVHACIEEISSLSAHADQSEIVRWLKGFQAPPQGVFLVHGEPHASDTLRAKLQDVFGWKVQAPELGQSIVLGG